MGNMSVRVELGGTEDGVERHRRGVTSQQGFALTCGIVILGSGNF